MRLFIGILTIAFAAAFGSVPSAKAQICDPSECANPQAYQAGKAARAKAKKVAVKKQKKPAKEQYMRVAP